MDIFREDDLVARSGRICYENGMIFSIKYFSGVEFFRPLRGKIYIWINRLKFIYDPINNSLSPEVTLINQFARYLGDRYIKFTEVSRTDLGT